jgi:DNA-binding transcriptional LysR family regulator
MNPTLRQIETFYWAARLGTFSAAAAKLNTTQPAVSARLQELEQSLAQPLFDRSRRSPRLTVEGRALLPYAERLMAAARDLAAASAAPLAAGIVRVGAADTVALTWLGRLVARLGQTHPDLTVEIRVDLSVNLAQALLDGALDVAFLAGPLPSPRISAKPLGTLDVAWFAAPGLLGRKRSLAPSDLARLPILTHNPGSHLHAAILDWFRVNEAVPTRLSACNSLATVIRLTLDGLGIAVLPPRLMREEVAAGRLTRISGGSSFAPQRFVAAWLADDPWPATSGVIEHAVSVVRDDPVFRG